MMRHIFVFGAVFLLLFGCINLDTNGDGDNNGDDNGVTELNPQFSVLYPGQGAKVETLTNTADVEVLLQTLDITLTAPSSNNDNGEGHFTIALNNEDPQIVVASTYTFEEVPLGEHTLIVEFVNNDGSSYIPQLKEVIYFSVALKDGVVLKPKEYNINLENGKFDPSSLTIKKGDILVFTNKEAMPHAIQVTKLPAQHIGVSEPLNKGESYSFTISSAGDYTFSSLTIPTIKGTLTVTE